MLVSKTSCYGYVIQPIRTRMTNHSLALGALIILASLAHAADSPVVECYRLKLPDGKTDMCQASDLCFGRLGKYDGLWIACDRNGGLSGNQIFLIDRSALADLKSGGDAVATRSFPTVGPAEGWERFNAEHARIAPEVLAELRRQFENFQQGKMPILDFEGITIAPRLSEHRADLSGIARSAKTQASGQADKTPKSKPATSTTPPMALFVVTEQPNSIVLEFALVDDDRPRAVLTDCFFYPEKSEDRGGDFNDGLEGIAWASKPGEFFICEEGTRPYRPNDNMHFYDQPRLMRCTLAGAWCNVEEPWSGRATESVRSQHDKPSQTLNALTIANDRTLLAVDRNGGWILAVDVPTGHATRYLSLYDPKLLDLRERLANYPGPRHMSYVSIEGIALDDHGDLWLCDDPAMPEPFRESCLIRLLNSPLLPR